MLAYAYIKIIKTGQNQILSITFCILCSLKAVYSQLILWKVYRGLKNAKIRKNRRFYIKKIARVKIWKNLLSILFLDKIKFFKAFLALKSKKKIVCLLYVDFFVYFIYAEKVWIFEKKVAFLPFIHADLTRFYVFAILKQKNFLPLVYVLHLENLITWKVSGVRGCIAAKPYQKQRKRRIYPSFCENRE